MHIIKNIFMLTTILLLGLLILWLIYAILSGDLTWWQHLEDELFARLLLIPTFAMSTFLGACIVTLINLKDEPKK